MAQDKFLKLLLNPRKWWIPLLVIFLISVAGVGMIGLHTYTEAPPIPTYTDQSGKAVIHSDDILKGQAVFQQYALMEYGSMFGDGANRGPDYTAEALHMLAVYMQEYYAAQTDTRDSLRRQGLIAQVQREIKINRYPADAHTVELTPAQVYAVEKLAGYYQSVFRTGDESGRFKPAGYIRDASEVRALSAFFFWGAWVCGVERPGENYSYTHNWPYDPEAGNRPSAAIILWSIIGALGLILGMGIVLYYHGKLEKLDDNSFTNHASPFMSRADIDRFRPHPIQRATYKFFYVAILLFALQVLAGILTVHDFVGWVHIGGMNLQEILPITVTRSWHVQLSLLWISACWIGASLFVMQMIHPAQPRGQYALVQAIFWVTVALVGGSMIGLFTGPKGLLKENWYWFGHQGWEYMEPGKIWQVLLGIVFILWAITLYRGIRPIMKLRQPWALPNWLVYATFSIILLLVSGFIATPKTNFVIADFWRWMVVHMWAEAFFEVFTTVLIGYFMVLMGLVSRQAVIRVIYLATLLFLGSGLLGISHNFYWNAKPVFTMALGSVFSTLQVIPLVLLTLEAWRFSKLPGLLESRRQQGQAHERIFGFREVFLFLLAVNFWNFFGAGVMGFIINLPIANYFEHGTYLTVNHGHAALMGVYGNLALAAVLFCCQLLFKPGYWQPWLLRVSFWSINLGLLLMVLLDLFPAGILQFQSVAEQGLWYARSAAFVEGRAFQSLTLLRIIGGALFTLGGLLPISWFILRGKQKDRSVPEPAQGLSPADIGAQFLQPAEN
jgi:nitric oxide reductase subunit B